MNYKALVILAMLFVSQIVFADLVASPTDVAIPLVVLGIIGVVLLVVVVVGIAILYLVYKYVTKQSKIVPVETQTKAVKAKGKKK